MGKLEVLSLNRTPDGVRQFGVFLPRPMPAEFLTFVAKVATKLPELSDAGIHFMAVADSGVPLATAIIMERSRREHLKRSDILTVIEPGRPDYLPQEIDSRRQHVIVDNSVKSMATINMVHHRLATARVKGSVLIKLIDYEDSIEQEQQEIIECDLGIHVVSLFRISDVLDEIPGSRERLLRWGVRFADRKG